MWEKIKEKYPKAYEEAQRVLFVGIDFTSQIGWLFKFFDERGIIVTTNPETWIIASDGNMASGDWITGINGESVATNPDRQSALKEGFEKAFEILEGQL